MGMVNQDIDLETRRKVVGQFKEVLFEVNSTVETFGQLDYINMFVETLSAGTWLPAKPSTSTSHRVWYIRSPTTYCAAVSIRPNCFTFSPTSRIFKEQFARYFGSKALPKSKEKTDHSRAFEAGLFLRSKPAISWKANTVWSKIWVFSPHRRTSKRRSSSKTMSSLP